MANYEYKCVPFIASVKSGLFSKDDAGTISSQLESVIRANAVDGWELYGVYQVQTLVKPGCFGAILGQKEAAIPYDIVTFRKPK